MTTHKRFELLVEPDLRFFEQLHRWELVPFKRLRVLELREIFVGRHGFVVLRKADRKRIDLLAELVAIKHLRRTNDIVVFVLFFDLLWNRGHDALGFLGADRFFNLRFHLDHLVINIVDPHHDGLGLAHESSKTAEQSAACFACA